MQFEQTQNVVNFLLSLVAVDNILQNGWPRQRQLQIKITASSCYVTEVKILIR